MIKEESNCYGLRLMCRMLSVSVSGYYAWLNRKPSLPKQRDDALSKKIKAIFDDEKSRAGAPRIARRLKHEGESIGKHRVARIMRENGWRAKAAKKFKATTNSNHQLPVAPHLLQQNFFSYKPNEKWVSDITYCWTEEGCCDGFVFTQSCWMGHVRTHDKEIGHRCPTDGYLEPKATARSNYSLRAW